MSTRRNGRRLALGVLASLSLVGAAFAAAATSSTGPNTSTDPYVLPAADGVEITSL
jgi:hypothetical protein